MLKILGGACFAFGIVDLISYYAFEYDITGFQYSPYIAFLVGWLVFKFAGDGSGEQE